MRIAIYEPNTEEKFAKKKKKSAKRIEENA